MNDNISNIKNSVYRFNFSISKLTGDTKTTKFIPLPKGIVKYLEIDDNLANMGFVGSVVFNNFYGIMEKLGLGSGVNDSTSLFDINIFVKNIGTYRIQGLFNGLGNWIR